MNKIMLVIGGTFVLIIGLTLCIDHSNVTSNEEHGRTKRFLSFANNSHFFVRLNFKANMVPWNQIFSQALGYRLNFDMPPDTFHPFFPRVHRRDLYNNMEVLFDRNGLSGASCIRRAICEVKRLPRYSGIYHKLLKIIFRRGSDATDKWHRVTREECDTSLSSCPFSLLDVSLYTDL